jgi:predicted phosphodiesterase
MRYTIVSDLHVNHPQPKTPKFETDLVIVAGDTGDGLVGMRYLDKLKRRGHTVFAVDGNHEHYGNLSLGRTLIETEKQFYEQLGHLPMMPTGEGYTIIGANGWYLVEDEYHWRNYLNDARWGDLSAEGVNARAQLHAKLIDTLIRAMPVGEQAIVVTHTSPCVETLDPRFAGSYGNEYFHNPRMRKVMSEHRDKIAIWHHGHTHAFADKIVEGVRVICNPRGYPGENPNWEPKVIEL